MISDVPVRDGEICLEFDPGDKTSAGVAFIGRLRTAWTAREDCPGNIRSARERSESAQVEVLPEYSAGLSGLRVGQGVILIYWMDQARRDLIVQAPRHADGLRGTFALRSPHRPNPLALSVVTITAIDPDSATLVVDALDCIDGTPLVDIKPWFAGLDMPADTEDQSVSEPQPA